MNVFNNLIARIRSLAPVAQLDHNLPDEAEATACSMYWRQHWTWPVLAVTSFLRVGSVNNPIRIGSGVISDAVEFGTSFVATVLAFGKLVSVLVLFVLGSVYWLMASVLMLIFGWAVRPAKHDADMLTTFLRYRAWPSMYERMRSERGSV